MTNSSPHDVKRILMIAPQPFYTDRGTPMNILLMCRVLTEAGFKLDLAVLPTGKKISLPGLSIYRPPRLPKLNHIPPGASWAKLIYDIFLSVYTLMLAASRRYSVIHGIEEGAIIAAVMGQATNTPVICDMDSYFPEQLRGTRFFGLNWIQKASERFFFWAASHSSLIIAVCEALAVQARHIAPHVATVRIEDIPLSEHGNGMDTSKESLSKDAIINRYGLGKNKIALYTGNLQKYQGIDLMLESWKWMKDRHASEKAILVIVGGTLSEIKIYKKHCHLLGIDDSVIWVGQRPAAEMDTWMDLADVLVSPRSLGDNTPLKIFSYMASGRVVVATRRPTHTQVVSENEAYLAEPEASNYAQALTRALSDKLESQKRARAAQEKIRQYYTFDVFRSKLLEAYSLILDANRNHDTARGWKAK